MRFEEVQGMYCSLECLIWVAGIQALWAENQTDEHHGGTAATRRRPQQNLIISDPTNSEFGQNLGCIPLLNKPALYKLYKVIRMKNMKGVYYS